MVCNTTGRRHNGFNLQVSVRNNPKIVPRELLQDYMLDDQGYVSMATTACLV